MILLFGGLAFSYTADGYDFQYRKDITIDSSKIDANLSYFPVLVKLASSNIDFNHFLHGTNDGYDIRFSDSIDGSGNAIGAILDYERERFDKSGEVAEIWVEIPTVNSGSDTTFYMFYGHIDCLDGQDVNGTWDEGAGAPANNFHEVFHLHEISGTHYDSTSNPYTGAISGSVDQNATGKIDGADEFPDTPSTDTYVLLSDCDLGNNASFSIEAWFRIYTSTAWAGIVTKGRETNNDWVGLWANGLQLTFGWDWQSGKGGNVDGSTLTTGIWYYAVATFDGTNRRLYLNESLDAGPDGGNYAGQTADTRVGNDGTDGTASSFRGLIDEIRISKIARPPEWVKASYCSGNDSLLTIPTLVELSYFRATSLDSAVFLEWATETELDNEGFNIWRSEEKDREYVRINPYFIPGEGDAGFGAEYSLTDYNVTNGVIYYYKLEEIDIYGKSTFHGPAPAVPHDIILFFPVEREKLHSGALLFSWASSSNYSFKVEISPSPAFPRSETLTFPESEWISGNSLWLAPREWEMVLNKAQSSGGQLFWRMKARNPEGKMTCSDWRRFLVEGPKLPEE